MFSILWADSVQQGMSEFFQHAYSPDTKVSTVGYFTVVVQYTNKPSFPILVSVGKLETTKPDYLPTSYIVTALQLDISPNNGGYFRLIAFDLSCDERALLVGYLTNAVAKDEIFQAGIDTFKKKGMLQAGLDSYDPDKLLDSGDFKEHLSDEVD